MMQEDAIKERGENLDMNRLFELDGSQINFPRTAAAKLCVGYIYIYIYIQCKPDLDLNAGSEA